MKRAISFLLILVLVGALAACKPQENPADDLEVSTGDLMGGGKEDQKEPTKQEDQTPEPTPDDQPQETPEDQPKEPDQTPEKEPEQEPQTPVQPDKTPEEEQEPEAKKAYLVGISVEKAERPNTAKVKDSDLLSCVYGKDTAFQNGDTVVYKVEMSNGGTTGFRFVKNSAKNCTISVDKNLITMSIDQKDRALDKAEFAITGSDENGQTKKITVCVTLYEYDEKALLEQYAKNSGLEFVDGGDAAINVTHRRASGHTASGTWVDQAAGFIDEAKSAGCKYYYYSMIDTYEFYAGTHLK